MLSKHYLAGVKATHFDLLRGVFVAADYRRSDSSRFLGTYEDLTEQKNAILRLARAVSGQVEQPGQWEVHHIVEGQHFADVDFAGRLSVAYERELPCVLIHRGEHRDAYNRLLHLKATDELFRDSLPKDRLARSKAAQKSFATPGAHAQLAGRLGKLDRLYHWVYEGDAVLQQVATNVFERLRGTLG
jgi:hypothetical protein